MEGEREEDMSECASMHHWCTCERYMYIHVHMYLDSRHEWFQQLWFLELAEETKSGAPNEFIRVLKVLRGFEGVRV